MVLTMDLIMMEIYTAILSLVSWKIESKNIIGHQQVALCIRISGITKAIGTISLIPIFISMVKTARDAKESIQ